MLLKALTEEQKQDYLDVSPEVPWHEKLLTLVRVAYRAREAAANAKPKPKRKSKPAKPKPKSTIPEAARENRTARCLWLLKLLSEAKDPVHDTELAVLFGTAERTIERDLSFLAELGVKLERSARGYRITEGYRLFLPAPFC